MSFRGTEINSPIKLSSIADSNKPPLASARASLAELLAKEQANNKSMSPTKPKKRF